MKSIAGLPSASLRENLNLQMALSSAFIETSRHYLQQAYRPKIERCLDDLSEDAVWWRPNDRSNSIGNLILHLAGNVRQYIVSGAGGEADIRIRDEEFAAREGVAKDDLLRILTETLADVDRVLEHLDPAALSRSIIVQGREMTVFEAVYHAVEHFSMHTGQIIYITKQLTGEDLGFYTFEGDAVRRKY